MNALYVISGLGIVALVAEIMSLKKWLTAVMIAMNGAGGRPRTGAYRIGRTMGACRLWCRPLQCASHR